MNNELHILGCGSALPTFQNSPACQVLELCDKSFMIDCGEGSQIWFRRMALRTARLYNVFVSHLHGDHCFGLIGLISTFDMIGRTQPLHIYSPSGLQELLQPLLDYHCQGMSYELIFHVINPRKSEVIFEDRTITVTTIPLKHKVPTCGFLFTEHHRDSEQVKRYAYCSDTRYTESVIPLIEGVQTLYHEATYLQRYADRCAGTMHSTAAEAATIAQKAHVGQLIIGHYSARVDNHQEYLDEAKPIFENTVLAQECHTYTI